MNSRHTLTHSRSSPGRTRVLGLLTLAAMAGFTPALPAADAKADPGEFTLFQLNLEDLMGLRIAGATGLTATDGRRLPVALTKFSAPQIEQSGATDLNRLLELHVPNAQFIDHHHLQPHLGFRGIISDREDKYLFQINGRTMNNGTLLGADNERALPLLGDINSVSVVRGPAAATHGAGAIAGVIDVQPFTGLTFQGSDLTLRQGFGQRYTAVEARHGRRLGPGAGVFVYYGAADVKGAESDYYIGRSFAANNGLPANVAGQPLPQGAGAHGGAGFGATWHKLHASFVQGPFEFWARFVQDGGRDRPMREIYSMTRPATVSLEEWTRGRQFQNRQFTVSGRFKQELGSQWSLDLSQSFDRWAFRDQRAGVYQLPTRNGREDEAASRAIAIWQPAEDRSLAFGFEYSHTWYHNPPFSDTLDRAPVVTERKWQANLFSVLTEYQTKIGERWTTFLSVRSDRHRFSDWLTSPRATAVFTPTEADTWKFMIGKSARRSGDEELWSQWARSRTIPKPESLLSYEVSYHRKLNDRWRAGAHAFYQNYDAIGWIPSLYYSSDIGKFDIAGGELTLAYNTRRTQITFSEGYSRLVRASLPAGAPAAGQTVTAEPYGYGNDLAEWAPFITKVALTHELSPAWHLSASAVHYSGFPGAKAYSEYAATFPTPPSAVPVSDRGYDVPYGPNLFVNAGVEFRPSRQWRLRLDAHNLAALADKTLSKRNYYFRLSEFSVQPAALTLTVRRTF